MWHLAASLLPQPFFMTAKGAAEAFHWCWSLSLVGVTAVCSYQCGHSLPFTVACSYMCSACTLHAPVSVDTALVSFRNITLHIASEFGSLNGDEPGIINKAEAEDQQGSDHIKIEM